MIPPGVQPLAPQSGQESVWDYPRPPRLEHVQQRITVRFRGVTICDTTHPIRVLETSHPPSYYLPMSDFLPGVLQPCAGTSVCEFKGAAQYFDIVGADGKVASSAAWGYPDPWPPFEDLRDHVALYAAMMDECCVDGERVIPQPGNFYGGWITSAVVGPFKGVPGSLGW